MHIIFLHQQGSDLNDQLPTFRDAALHFVDETIGLMQVAEEKKPDAIVIPSDWEECNLVHLMDALKSVAHGSAILLLGTPKVHRLVEIVNFGQVDQILEFGNEANWRGQIMRAIAKRNELKNTLQENERLEKRANQLEFHVRQFMMMQEA